MKYHACMPLAVFCVILAGCERQGPETTTANSAPVEPTNASASTLTDQATDATDAAVQRLAETREEAVQAMSGKLAAWEAKIASLQTKTEGLGEAAKQSGSEAIAGLRREFDQAGTYLTEVGTAGKDQWREIKSKFDETMERLSAAYDAAARELQSDS
jgi:prophage DNA circulation protein